MTRPNAHSSGSSTVDREAAEWVLREARGLSVSDQRDLERWLANRSNAAAYSEMKETSALLDGLKGNAGFERPSSQIPWNLWMAAGLAAVFTIAVIWQKFGPVAVRASDDFTQAAETAVGEYRRLELKDGSVVRMNTATDVQVVYTSAERRVKLTRGEAFFDVAKNPDRPFWVTAGKVSLRAVGTAFNVRVRDDAIEVLVKEGRVEVSQEGSDSLKPLLRAGQQAIVPLKETDRAISLTPVSRPKLENALAWQSQRLEFSDTPLAEVVAEFNRYNRHQLVIEDHELAAQTFGGVFSPTSSESFVEILQASFGVVAERREGVTILRKAARK